MCDELVKALNIKFLIVAYLLTNLLELFFDQLGLVLRNPTSLILWSNCKDIYNSGILNARGVN